jgi:polysaccharide export outer membrane protein
MALRRRLCAFLLGIADELGRYAAQPNARAVLLLGPALLFTASCHNVHPGSAIDSASSRQIFMEESANGGLTDYRISPLDRINITVFQVKDLSLTDVQVDANGHVLLPLIGSVDAGGRTTTELSAEIAAKLQEKYLQQPQVSVVVSESVSQKVTVEGAVTEPGVYELKGPTTLLQAIAMAKGPSRVASLPHIAVFRRVDGKRMAAVFDLNAIRSGSMDDPQILANDEVVVGLSNLKAGMRDALAALPAIAVFSILR